MGTTSEFVKYRSTGEPRPGEWNADYAKTLAAAKRDRAFVVAAWSNGDACSFCVYAEKCMMTPEFRDWMAKQKAYFVFQHSGDKDKGRQVYDWIFKDGGVKQYPGFRVTLYGADGSVLFDKAATGNELRGGAKDAAGAANMIAALESFFAEDPGEDGGGEGGGDADYKVRLNEALTTAQVNKVLDAVDRNDGYCPCQPKGDGTKCHCEDFVKEKKIGEPCICKIYVKQAK